MKTVKLFVEGGGDSKSLRTECRAAFSSFLQKSGLSGHMPRIVASGSRNAAYSDFCTALKNGEDAALLVDSETEVANINDGSNYNTTDPKTWKPWNHLVHRRGQTGELADHWEKPLGASDDDCHLMVQSMESWFLADVASLKEFYGREYNVNRLPNRLDIENVQKETVLAALRAAAKDTQKGSYDKGAHSFKILAVIDPNKVMHQSPWAKRFISLLSEKMRSMQLV